MTYIYKPEPHRCSPPNIRDSAYADAHEGSIWRCSCGDYFVVKLNVWKRVGFLDFAARRRIEAFETAKLVKAAKASAQ